MKTHVSGRQLEDAFRRHWDFGHASADSGDSALLLLVYALECGLKRLLLHRRGIHTTAKLAEDDFTHDLDALLKLLGEKPRFGMLHTAESRVQVSPERLHEVLRYGVRLESIARGKVLEHVRELQRWIAENLP